MTWTIEEVPTDSPLLDEAALACAQRLEREEYENILCLVASKNGTPQAALVASMYVYLYKAQVEHLALYTSGEDPSALQSLLEEAQRHFQKHRISVAVFLYPEVRKDRPALEKELYNAAWSLPRPMIRQYYIDIASLRPPWLMRERHLPEGYEIFPWSELTDKERRKINVQANQGYYPYDVFPYGQSGDPEPRTSVGLRADGKVIGWMATHKMDQDTLAYSALYIDAKWRAKKLSMAVLCESIRRHKTTEIPVAYFKLNLKRISDDWYAFVKEGLAPHAFKIEDILNSQKRIPKPRPTRKQRLQTQDPEP